MQILRWLRSTYGVQPILPPEVEIELRSHRRHAPQIQHDVKKAITSGTLVIADRSYLDLVAAPPAAADGLYRQIQTTGAKYALRVGRGEAYVHAWALNLGVPALSNDERAVKALLAQALIPAAPVVRFYDLLVLGLQTQFFAAAACDSIRSDLRSKGEGIAQDFENQSLTDGLRTFVPRLIDAAAPLVGQSGSPLQNVGYQARLTLTPL